MTVYNEYTALNLRTGYRGCYTRKWLKDGRHRFYFQWQGVQAMPGDILDAYGFFRVQKVIRRAGKVFIYAHEMHDNLEIMSAVTDSYVNRPK